MSVADHRQHSPMSPLVDRAEGRVSDPAHDPEPVPGQPRPRCPACFGIACPRCHKADAVRMPWHNEEHRWHYVCQRCSIAFLDDVARQAL